MSKGDQNIKSKLEQFEPQVAPSLAEIKRFNESLDVISKRRWILRFWWAPLLLLFFFGNIWYLMHTNKQNALLITELKNEIVKNNQKDNATHPKLDKVYGAIDSMSKALQMVSAQNESLINKVESLENQIGIYQNTPKLGFYNRAPFRNTIINTTLSKAEEVDEEKAKANIELAEKEEKAPKNKQAEYKGQKPKIVFDSTSIDSFTKDIIEKLAEKQGADKTTNEISTPIELDWFAGLSMRSAMLNTYFVKARTPFSAGAIGGFQYNRFQAFGGLGYRYLGYKDISANNLTAEIDEIGDVPSNIAATAEELYSSSHSLILPLGVSYNFADGPFYGSLATTMHLYSFQTFKIESERNEISLEKRHPEIQFFNYRLGLGYNYSFGANLQMRLETGFTFGNPNFDLLLRERSGAYLKLNLLYY